MRILVIGCGSIGRRHIRLLREMGVEVGVVDTNPIAMANAYAEFPGLVGSEWSTPKVWTLDWALDCNWDGAIVATPPHLHFQPATAALAHTGGVLLEKPIATDECMASSLVMAADAANKPLLVGYNLRFHPGLRRVKELLDDGTVGTVRCARIHFGSYLPDWRPGSDYRQGYAARRNHGGGVILDASHELDYACWLFGEPVAVSCVAQNTGALEIETEDVADLVVTFASGVQVNIHLDYLSRQYRRGCEIVGDGGNLCWEWPGSHVLKRSPSMMDDYVWHEWAVDPDDLYRAELKHFLACLRGEEQPLCTGEDGLRALRLALAARESAETGRVVRL